MIPYQVTAIRTLTTVRTLSDMTTLTMPMGLVNLDMLANLHSDEPLLGRQMVWYWRTCSMGMADSCGMAYLFISCTSLLKNWESDTNQKIANSKNTYINILR